jgi:hypothetical protein
MGEHLLHAANLLLPGSGLVVHGRPWLGSLLLAAAACTWCLAALAQIGIPGYDGGMLRGVVAYGLLAALAELMLSISRRRPSIDSAALREGHRQTCAAYLRGELPAALHAARSLTRLAADEPGSWRLLALVAGAQDHQAAHLAEARRAQARARSLEDRRTR